jgi:hypothetical protein
LILARGRVFVSLDPARRLRVHDALGFQDVWANESDAGEGVDDEAGVVEYRWNDGTRAVVNHGQETRTWRPRDDDTTDREALVLPPGGFVVDHHRFRAFHLLAGFGQRFAEASLFVVRSLDHLPIESSTRVRVFRGFGGPAVLVANVHGQMLLGDEVITREVAGFLVPVEREAVVLFHDWYG